MVYEGGTTWGAEYDARLHGARRPGIVSKMEPPQLIAGEIFRRKEIMGVKNSRSHRPPGNIYQGIRGRQVTQVLGEARPVTSGSTCSTGLYDRGMKVRWASVSTVSPRASQMRESKANVSQQGRFSFPKIFRLPIVLVCSTGQPFQSRSCTSSKGQRMELDILDCNISQLPFHSDGEKHGLCVSPFPLMQA